MCIVAEEKTRIISAAEAASEAVPNSPAPKLVGDKVVFYCANGHKLVVAVKHAGKRGKCDKAGCGVAVVIPSAAPSIVPEVTDEPPAEVGSPEPEQAEQEPEGGAAEATAADAQAATGDPQHETAAEPEAAVSTAAGNEESWQFMGGGESVPETAGADSVAGVGAWTEDNSPETQGDAFDNPTARLVARLWVERDHGGIVELHLTGGSVILPEWYEARWSRGTHGLFASQSADGTITLTAVAWEAIQKVVVRQVKGLPDGMFE